MEPRVDIIVNRLARRLASGGAILRALHEEVAASGGRARLHETASFDDLATAVASIRDRTTDCVVLAGGDGSYLAGTTALRHAFGDALPPIAFAPGGTVCTVARNWGLRGPEEAYARTLIRQVRGGSCLLTTRPTLRVRDDRGGDRVGFIFGAGLVARFFDAYYEAPRQGYAAAAGLVARIFTGTFTSGDLARRVLSPGPARVFVDGELQAPTSWSLIAASVVRDLGIHMRLLYRAGESETAFHAVASALPPRQLAPQVGRVLLGRPLSGDGHVDVLTRELRVELAETSGGGDRPSTYVLDGDRIAASHVTVTPGPVLRYASVAS